MSLVNQTLLRLEVSETNRNRSYWASRPWLSPGLAQELGASAIVVVPWENFRENVETTFPQGTTDLVRSFRDKIGSIFVAVDEDKFCEISLHADEKRLPTLLFSMVLLPLALGVIANEIDKRAFPVQSDKPPVSVELIIEGDMGKCISLKYQGPSEHLAETVMREAGRCFPSEVSSAFQHRTHKSRPRKRGR